MYMYAYQWIYRNMCMCKQISIFSYGRVCFFTPVQCIFITINEGKYRTNAKQPLKLYKCVLVYAYHADKQTGAFTVPCKSQCHTYELANELTFIPILQFSKASIMFP